MSDVWTAPEPAKRLKKAVAILLYIDTTETNDSSMTARTDIRPNNMGFPVVEGADEAYAIRVNNATSPTAPGVFNNPSMLNDAAHELGHALSSIFEVPGGMMDDPRTKGEFQNLTGIKRVAFEFGLATLTDVATPEQRERILVNEKLAWDIAEKIRPGLNQAERERAYGTYLKRSED
jgi:hypothetical protein